PPPAPTLLPYTTLFRSFHAHPRVEDGVDAREPSGPVKHLLSAHVRMGAGPKDVHEPVLSDGVAQNLRRPLDGFMIGGVDVIQQRLNAFSITRQETHVDSSGVLGVLGLLSDKTRASHLAKIQSSLEARDLEPCPN